MMTDQTMDTPRIVILISGTGSNMITLAEKARSGEIPGMVAAVLCNRPEAVGIQHAKDRDIPVEVLDHKDFDSREAFDAAMIPLIDQYQPDLVVLAGFMRILSEDFVRRYQGRMLNIHPSLLPKYQGLNTHQRAIDAGDSVHGVSVHFVTEELDGGPVVIQAVVPVLNDDDAPTLQKRVQQQEHIIYPIAVKWFVEGRLKMSQAGEATLDGQALSASGIQLTD